MREVISLHVGQGGVQTGSSMWELFCLEHGISPDGSVSSDKGINDIVGTKIFFAETPGGKYVPRALFADLDPITIDDIRHSAYRGLYHPGCLVSGQGDACTYAAGYKTRGKELTEVITEQIRKQAEASQSLQGFLISFAISGGTGSGVSSLILRHLKDTYGKKQSVGLNIFPSPKIQTQVVEPYNSVLCSNSLIHDLDVSIVMDNEALYNICQNSLEMDKPSYQNINRIIAQLTSSITSSLRFDGSLYSDLTEYQINLIPYPRLHFLTSSFAPIIAQQRLNQEQTQLIKLTNDVVNPDNFLVSQTKEKVQHMALSLLYRGDINPKDVNTAIADIKQKETVKLVDWIPIGYKVGINYSNNPYIPEGDLAKASKSVTMLSNTINIFEVFNKFITSFDSMYSKRAFVHWYVGEGMEEGEFSESREHLAGLEKEYAKMVEPGEGEGEDENQQELQLQGEEEEGEQ